MGVYLYSRGNPADKPSHTPMAKSPVQFFPFFSETDINRFFLKKRARALKIPAAR
jgi:hypothetical protein